MIVACPGSAELARKIAKKSKKKFSKIFVSRFPDSETYLRFDTKVKNRKIILVQSFYGNVNDDLVEAMFAAATARSLGAKKISLVAPYFPYFRQDKRFRKGECINIEIVAKLIDSYFDEIFIIDPHLHRKNKLSNIFRIKSHNLTANSLIADYIEKNIKNPVLIGPDIESYKWAEKTAKMIKCDYTILRKLRKSAREVKVKMKEKIDFKDRNAVIVDDIISTGHTLLETIKHLKRLGAKKITCIAVHGLFAENALEKLRKTGAKIIATNTIPNPVAKIDVSGLVAESLQ